MMLETAEMSSSQLTIIFCVEQFPKVFVLNFVTHVALNYANGLLNCPIHNHIMKINAKIRSKYHCQFFRKKDFL